MGVLIVVRGSFGIKSRYYASNRIIIPADNLLFYLRHWKVFVNRIHDTRFRTNTSVGLARTAVTVQFYPLFCSHGNTRHQR